MVRKAKRRSRTYTGTAYETSRITANTGWVHRSSAKASSLLQQHGESTQEQGAHPWAGAFKLFFTPLRLDHTRR
jgi:hypothetical protein